MSKRSTRKLLWEKRSKDYAVGVIRQRGKPDTIVIRVRKGSDTIISMDTVPPTPMPEHKPFVAPDWSDFIEKLKKSGPLFAALV